MAAKLHQILAVERTTSAETKRILGLAIQGLGVTGEQSPLSGISRTYTPRDDDGDKLPGKFQHVQIKVEADIMPMIAEAVTRMLDVKYTRDEGNTHARADVTVDGTVILKNVPTTYLLTLENELGELGKLLTQLPVLDPSVEWDWDTNRSAYASKPATKERSIPVPQVQVLYGATKEHPAQVRPYETAKPVGDWTEVKFSGAMPAQAKEQILRRLSKLQEAVKMAREEANRIDVQNMHAGKNVFDYLFARK